MRGNHGLARGERYHGRCSAGRSGHRRGGLCGPSTILSHAADWRAANSRVRSRSWESLKAFPRLPRRVLDHLTTRSTRLGSLVPVDLPELAAAVANLRRERLRETRSTCWCRRRSLVG